MNYLIPAKLSEGNQMMNDIGYNIQQNVKQTREQATGFSIWRRLCAVFCYSNNSLESLQNTSQCLNLHGLTFVIDFDLPV